MKLTNATKVGLPTVLLSSFMGWSILMTLTLLFMVGIHWGAVHKEQVKK